MRQALVIVALAVIWQGAVTLFHVSPDKLPPLSRVLETIGAQKQEYLRAFFHTAAETLAGFLAGACVGVLAGIVFAQARLLKEMFFPLFIVSQTIPVVAFGAIVILWFGSTLLAKAVIAFYLTFFPVTVNTLLGLTSVDPRQDALLRSFGAGRMQLLWKLHLPSALPQIFVALRLSASLGLVGAIVGEWFGDTTGIGVLLLQALFNEQVAGLWAAILVSALLGTLLYGAVAWLERRLVFWRAEQ